MTITRDALDLTLSLLVTSVDKIGDLFKLVHVRTAGLTSY